LHYKVRFRSRSSFKNSLPVEELQKRKQAYKAHQELKVIRKQQCKSKGIEYVKTKFEYVVEVLKNGDTVLRLLACSRGLLFKTKSAWSASQQQRAGLLFKTYPKLKTVYHQLLVFRRWVDKDQVGKAIRH